ncbi:CAP domain-containing protein [Candidatus Gracilibacteria bacterium]|nr:CAP domain-containing protein [Candidatus Gracilibacteria bacterium]
MHRRVCIAALLLVFCLALPRFAAAYRMQAGPAATITVHLPLIILPPAAPTQTPEQRQMADELLGLVNAARATSGCAPVTFEAHLTAAAQGHSRSMAEQDYFDHIGPDGATARDRADAAGFSGQVGENIAAGYTTAEQVMQGWMNSEGHRKNILNCDYSHVGIGYLYQSNDQPGVRMPSGEPSDWPFYYYWTQMFGIPE